MNYKTIALIIAVLIFLFQTYMEWLKIKSAHRPIPENVKDIYDETSYRKWLSYYREKARISLIRHILGYFAVFVILVFDVYAKIVNGLSITGVYSSAIAVLLVDLLVSLFFSIPLDYVDQMKVEQKYGFNRMTKKTFITDQIKDILLEMILVCGLCCLFILIHRALANWLLPVFTGIMLLFVLLLVFISPAIGKIHNKFEPLPEGELRERLTTLLAKNGCSVRAIHVMDGSKRSSKANAYFTGFGKSKTIVLYDTLLEQMTDDEIVAIFAHEMGHNKHKDTLKMYAMNILNIVVCVLSAWALVSVPEIYRDFGFEELNYGFAFYLLANICLTFLSPLFGLVSGAVSRKGEYAADRFAAENGYGGALISSLRKLSKNTFLCLTPHPILVALTNTHPTVSQRIEALEKIK